MTALTFVDGQLRRYKKESVAAESQLKKIKLRERKNSIKKRFEANFII